MKKIILFIALLAFTVNAQQQASGIYELSTGWVIIDGANGSNTAKIDWAIPETHGGVGIANGYFTVWVQADTIKADVCDQDSLSIYYKVVKCDGNKNETSNYTVSNYDSTSVVTYFDWDHGYKKHFTITPPTGCGLEFKIIHTTEASDSIKVKIDLDFQ